MSDQKIQSAQHHVSPGGKKKTNKTKHKKNHKKTNQTKQKISLPLPKKKA